VPLEQAVEPMLTLEEVSKQFQVSTKTVSRWRMRGLTSRRVKAKGRSQLRFPRSVVEKFAAEHRELVERGSKFSHLTDAEKDDILRLAREMRESGSTLTEVSKKIAAQLNRSPEAVRYTIKNHDRVNPDHQLFPAVTGPLTSTAKEHIYMSKQKGAPVDLLAKQFGRTRSSMYRVINEVRARELIQKPIDYIYNPDFDDTKKSRAMLTKDQEQHLFRKMNFLKHKLHKMRKSIDPAKARTSDLEQMAALQDDIKDVRDILISCNQRLVYNNAKKHLGTGENIDDLVSDGNLSLMRAVEKFDYARGFKFSTYATWAIIKNFARSIPDEKTHKQRYMTGHDDLFDAKADVRTDEGEVVAAADAARSRVTQLLEHLDPRTREVIRRRMGLDGSEEMTLEQIGQHFGITKERVRQINVRGMKQLREWAAKENVDAP